MLMRIFSIVFPVFAVVAIGWWYARQRALDMQVANQLNLNVFIPALLFSVLVQKEIVWGEYAYLLLGGLVIILGSGLLSWPVAKWLKVSPATLLPPMMYTNTGNLGLPIAVFALGEVALPGAVLLFILQTFLQFSLGLRMLDRQANLWVTLKIPVLLATIAGLLVNISGWTPPELLLRPLDMLGQIAIPLMLFALGVRLRDFSWRAWKVGVLSAILCPLSGLLFYWVLVPFLGLTPLHQAQLLLFAVLPPAIMNYMLAEQYRQEPEQVAAIVMFGNLFSFASIPLALFFIPVELLA